MRRFVIFAVLSAMFTACSSKYDDYVVDWAPLVMHVYLHDTEGNNLLDTESKACYDLSNIKLTYQGVEYGIDMPNSASKRPLAYLARFKDPYIGYNTNGEAYLRIGEWNRDMDWNNCYVEIAWGDGTTDKLSFTHSVSINSKHLNNPNKNFGHTFTTYWYLNDEPNGSWQYHLVK